ncbi:Endoplasmic reticulum-golgi intermediate compartment protein, partial [Globisporangium splendens]
MQMRQRAVKGDVDDVGSNAEGRDGDLSRSARRVLKRVDVYPKMHREFKVQTEFGATAFLLLSMRAWWMTYYDSVGGGGHRDADPVFVGAERVPEREHARAHGRRLESEREAADQPRHQLPCAFLQRHAHVNAMDVAGDLQMDMYQTIKKTRLDRFGNAIERPVDVGNADKKGRQTTPPGYCGSCYDAKHPAGKKCCNTCDEVKEAFIASDMALEEAEQKEQCIRESNADEMLAQDGEGCRFEGNMLVNRVAGNFHVALGRTFHREGRLVHQFRPGQEMTFNASHIIHSLSFGTPYPGSIGPLDGTVKITESSRADDLLGHLVEGALVPATVVDNGDNRFVFIASQFSYTQQSRYLDPFGQMSALPGTFFVFDLSPFMVKVDNDRVPLTHFLTNICAIIGGVVSIAGFVDSFMYNSLNVRGGPTVGGSSTNKSQMGDLRNSRERLKKLLKRIQYPHIATLETKSVQDLLRILHFALLDFSRVVAQFILDKGYDLYGKTDARFIDSAFRLMRDEFKYFPSLNSTQFLSEHYWERKLNVVADILQLLLDKHSETTWLKRQQAAVWTKPKECEAYLMIKIGMLAKTEAARVENHLIPASQLTDHAASVLQLLQHSGKARRRHHTAAISGNFSSRSTTISHKDREAFDHASSTQRHGPRGREAVDPPGDSPPVDQNSESTRRSSRLQEHRVVHFDGESDGNYSGNGYESSRSSSEESNQSPNTTQTTDLHEVPLSSMYRRNYALNVLTSMLVFIHCADTQTLHALSRQIADLSSVFLTKLSSVENRLSSLESRMHALETTAFDNNQYRHSPSTQSSVPKSMATKTKSHEAIHSPHDSDQENRDLEKNDMLQKGTRGTSSNDRSSRTREDCHEEEESAAARRLRFQLQSSCSWPPKPSVFERP